jgi:hypothetical protein
MCTYLPQGCRRWGCGGRCRGRKPHGRRMAAAWLGAACTIVIRPTAQFLLVLVLVLLLLGPHCDTLPWSCHIQRQPGGRGTKSTWALQSQQECVTDPCAANVGQPKGRVRAGLPHIAQRTLQQEVDHHLMLARKGDQCQQQRCSPANSAASHEEPPVPAPLYFRHLPNVVSAQCRAQVVRCVACAFLSLCLGAIDCSQATISAVVQQPAAVARWFITS